MTVKLLRAYGGFQAGALYDGSAETEQALLAAGNATAELRHALPGGGPGDNPENVHSVLEFGAVEGGADCTAAIRTAIHAVSAAGGGTLVFPRGVFACNNLVVESPRVRLVGAGAGWFSGSHTERGSTLLYNGTAGGDILTLSSPSGAATQKISDCAVLGLALDGAELAARGLVVATVNRSEFDLSAAGCTSVQCEWKTVAECADTTNNQHNLVRYLRVRAIGAANGIKFDTDVLPGNTSMNVFGYLYAQHDDGYGVRLGNVDNNVFQHIVCSRLGGGTGVGIVLGAGDNTTRLNARANNILICSPGEGGLVAEGTPSDTLPSVNNRILCYDKDNPNADPVIETDAELAWCSTDNVLFSHGFASAGFSNSLANAINARQAAVAAQFPVVIVSGNGNHLQLHDGSNGKWNFKVDEPTGVLSIFKAGTQGYLALGLDYVSNYANDGAAAAGGIAVGGLYRNGSVLMIRAA